MAPKSKSRHPLSELEDRAPKDFDPEDTRDPNVDSDDEDSDDEQVATEHYVSVGKSKLRQKEPLALGPQYQGARVSREALENSDGEGDESGSDEEDEYDDPDEADLEVAEAAAAGEDPEIDSDEAFGSGDEERFKGYTFRGSAHGPARKRRPVASDFMSDDDKKKAGTEDDEDEEDGEEEDEEDEDDDEDDNGADLSSDGSGDVDMNGTGEASGSEASDDSDGGAPLGSGSDEEMDSDDDSSPRETGTKKNASNSDVSKDKKPFLSSLSESQRLDAEKGIAVRQQRKIFDGLLNLRVRLQKALVSANTFGHVTDPDDDGAGREAYEAAEEAALKLWSTIDDLRSGINGSRAGEKRKREDPDVSTSTSTVWGYMADDETIAKDHRDRTLDKWSSRVNATTVRLGSGKLNLNGTGKDALSDVLGEQLADRSRLVKRARVPRSCAPAQAAKRVREDPRIYDDADFYQALLKELVDQRSEDALAGAGPGAATVQWGAVKEAKTSRVVDRKASRGRKMRFTVHEKLAGFMAAEDRRSWEDEAIDRFFGTLFGQRMALHEAESESEDEVNAEEAGLKLFRS